VGHHLSDQCSLVDRAITYIAVVNYMSH